MKILSTQNLLQKQSENLISGELSNVAAVVQAPQIFVDYFPIDVDSSTTIDGFDNVTDYIGKESPVVFNHIDNLPLTGIDNLIIQASFDEELGTNEDFQSSAIIFPNTIIPKSNEFFIIKNMTFSALFVVTNVQRVTVRSNPFTEIQFRLFSRDQTTIDQLYRQVRTEYTTTVTAIGLDKSLVIQKESLYQIENHINNYLSLSSMYQTTFYDTARGAFIYDNYYDQDRDMNIIFIDMMLWKFMFDLGVVIFDDVVTYASNNFKKSVDRIYTGCPDSYISDYDFQQTILYRILAKDKKHDIGELRYPSTYDLPTQLAKFQGVSVYYIEKYLKISENNLYETIHFVWDDEFVDKIKTNTPYDPTEERFQNDSIINPYMRNIIIAWYNDTEIDWEDLVIINSRSIENYVLIPIILAFYKDYIGNLQK